VPGADATVTAGPQAAWYFADELVAVPRDHGAGFARHTRPMHDVRRWNELHPRRAPRELAPLVWIGAGDRVPRARVEPDAQWFVEDGRRRPLQLVPRLASNRSWFDERSAAYCGGREIAMRGTSDGDAFVARTLWPLAWQLGPGPAPAISLPPAARPGLALRALMRSTRIEAAEYKAVSLWQRGTRANWIGKAVLAFVVNGAQGDDDEAHAGHFSIATGRIAEDGDIASWLVNSIYALDVVSEKGILAAPVPLDRYQADLNSGQSWYRPSWVLALVLDDDRAAVRVQSALGRVFRHFWRQQLAYYHPTDNCTSIAMDTLRSLGLDVPRAGPTARLAAWAALPWLVVRERSLDQAKTTFDYLVTERTRLLPAVALEALFEHLWALVHRTRPPGALLESELAEDMAAIAWLELPQLPSSRAWGDAPAVSLDEYRARVPTDPDRRQIIPLPPRTLPEALQDDDLLPRLPHPSDLAVRWWAVAPLALAALALVLRGS
jgi:hypothetical protein